MTSLDDLLKKSAHAIKSYQSEMAKCSIGEEFAIDDEKRVIDQESSLSNLIATLMTTKIGLKKELFSGKAVYINEETVQTIDSAINKLMHDASIEAKVNAIQMMLLRTNTPLWSVLKDVQQLLQTVETLKVTRGKRVSHIEDMEKNRDEPET